MVIAHHANKILQSAIQAPPEVATTTMFVAFQSFLTMMLESGCETEEALEQGKAFVIEDINKIIEAIKRMNIE
jgi:hypothetical protein